jgi:hypothetical protein
MAGIFSSDQSIVLGTMFLAAFADIKEAFPKDYARRGANMITST